MNLYRVNGITIDEDRFKEKILDTLKNYKFASLSDLAVLLKAKQKDIYDVLGNIIVAYVRENPTKTYLS